MLKDTKDHKWAQLNNPHRRNDVGDHVRKAQWGRTDTHLVYNPSHTSVLQRGMELIE